MSRRWRPLSFVAGRAKKAAAQYPHAMSTFACAEKKGGNSLCTTSPETMARLHTTPRPIDGNDHTSTAFRTVPSESPSIAFATFSLARLSIVGAGIVDDDIAADSEMTGAISRDVARVASPTSCIRRCYRFKEPKDDPVMRSQSSKTFSRQRRRSATRDNAIRTRSNKGGYGDKEVRMCRKQGYGDKDMNEVSGNDITGEKKGGQWQKKKKSLD